MGKHEDLIDMLYRLYSEDGEKRQDLLKATVTDDIEFYGLQTSTFGIEEFDKSFRSLPAEGHLVRTTPVESQGEWIRCGWELRLPDGTVAGSSEGLPYAGLQVSRLSQDGRLRNIVAFRGIAPPN